MVVISSLQENTMELNLAQENEALGTEQGSL